jgi:hypothetical protein
MAKGKAKAAVKRSYGKAKSAYRRRPKVTSHAASTAGLLISAAEFLVNDPEPNVIGSPLANLTVNDGRSIADRFNNTLNAVKANAMKPEIYVPAVAGAAISAAPRIPIVRIVAKPLDKTIKGVTKGKVGL